MMLGREILMGLFFLAAASATICHGDDFYVDAVNGSDQTGDGSAANPWLTITYSLAQIGPGDLATEHTLFVREGVYDGALGEVFPLQPGIQVSLVATGRLESTVIQGGGPVDLLQFDKRLSDGGRQEVVGLHLRDGKSGIVWALVYSGGGSPLVIRNTTITGCSHAGVYLPPGTGYSAITIEACRIIENQTGVLAKSTFRNSGIEIRRTQITDNKADGFYLLGDGALNPNFQLSSNVIARNGGAGILIKSDHLTPIGGTLTNNTISHNARGGFEGRSYSQCYYIPYYGYRCYYGRIGPFSNHNNTIYGNGPPGGMTGNNPAYVTTQGASCIVWANTPVDVGPGFQHLFFSNVGTGGAFGTGTISQPPQFVNGPGGDFRLTKSSPCLDSGDPFPSSNVPATDIEREDRVLDGGSGVARIDMGSDEFATFVAPVAPPVKGSSFQLFTQAPPAEEGLAVVVLLSFGSGAGGGIPLPGSGGRRVALDPDSLFNLGLGLLPMLQTTITSGQGATTPVAIPAGLPLSGDIYYAGVSIDLAAGQYVSITPTHSFEIQ